MQRRFVIDRDLFAGRYIAHSYEEYVIVNNLHERIGHTRMVDVVSTIAAAAAVETPATIDLTDSQHFSMRSATSLSVRNLLAGVLRDLVSFFERNRGVASLAVYGRRLDG